MWDGNDDGAALGIPLSPLLRSWYISLGKRKPLQLSCNKAWRGGMLSVINHILTIYYIGSFFFNPCIERRRSLCTEAVKVLP